jgi:hypothetical protein
VQTFEELLHAVESTPSYRTALEVIAEHKDAFNLIVNGNKTIENKLIVMLLQCSAKAYEAAIEDLKEFMSEPEIPLLEFVVPSEDENER